MLEKVMQNAANSKIHPKSFQNLSKNRWEMCGPKIDEKSSRGAPKGRQGDFGFLAVRSSWARGVHIQ